MSVKLFQLEKKPSAFIPVRVIVTDNCYNCVIQFTLVVWNSFIFWHGDRPETKMYSKVQYIRF